MTTPRYRDGSGVISVHESKVAFFWLKISLALSTV